MAHVALVPLNELHSQLVQSLEMITGVGDFPRFVPKPTNDIEYAIDIDLFFSLRICVIVTEIAMSLVILSISEIDCDSFRVSNV